MPTEITSWALSDIDRATRTRATANNRLQRNAVIFSFLYHSSPGQASEFDSISAVELANLSFTLLLF